MGTETDNTVPLSFPNRQNIAAHAAKRSPGLIPRNRKSHLLQFFHQMLCNLRLLTARHINPHQFGQFI